MSNDELDDVASEYGRDRAIALIKRELSRDAVSGTLTIIANEGIHHLPDAYKRGELYIASRGNLDFSSLEIVKEQYEEILSLLAIKLKSQTWKNIYLVPFGHSTLCMQIKLLVFRVTRIETIDLFYDGRGNYEDLSIAQRSLIVNVAS